MYDRGAMTVESNKNSCLSKNMPKRDGGAPFSVNGVVVFQTRTTAEVRRLFVNMAPAPGIPPSPDT